MNLKYTIAPLVTWVISQTLKVFYRTFIRKEKFSWRHTGWIYMYGDGAPSTHSAMLSSVLVVIGAEQGIGPLFYFAFTASLIIIYGLLEDRKKEVILEGYLEKSNDPAMRDIVKDGRMFDMSGHGFFEIIVGVVLGVLLGLFIQKF